MTEKVRLTLMNKNIPVIDFDYDIELNVIREIFHNYPNNEKYAPISIFDLKIGISKVLLMNWFRNRIMPETRDGIDEYLKKYDNNYDKFMIDLISKRHGFNLSDQYWFKFEGEDVSWEEGNYFTNHFDEGIGKKINSNDFSTPSSSTNGNLYKKWIIEENDRYLLKGGTLRNQEPFNEVIATKLYERVLLENEYVSYTLYKEDKRLFSKCKCFINRDTELVPAWDIIKVLKQKSEESDYSFFLRCADYLEVFGVKEYMNKMLTCDYILGNSDRHYNNFGAIRDVNTLEYVGMSPIFDSGNSLGVIRNDQAEFTTAPFYKNPKKQLLLVDDLSWLDFDKLNGFLDEVREILESNTLLGENYIDKQIEDLKVRISDVEKYKEELNSR